MKISDIAKNPGKWLQVTFVSKSDGEGKRWFGLADFELSAKGQTNPRIICGKCLICAIQTSHGAKLTLRDDGLEVVVGKTVFQITEISDGKFEAKAGFALKVTLTLNDSTIF